MDPKGAGTIEAMAAAKFLKKSGLSDVVLSRVWDLSDPNGKGYLDKPGFYVALKLVSLAQHGHVYNMNNIYMDTERPPKVVSFLYLIKFLYYLLLFFVIFRVTFLKLFHPEYLHLLL